MSRWLICGLAIARRGAWKSLALMLCAVSCVQAAPADTSLLQGLGEPRYHRFESGALGHPLHLYVRLPAGAAQRPDERFPTVYLLDGGNTFPLLSAYHHYLRLGEEQPELILVGISYGSDTFEGGNYRSGDYTAPAADREWWGGAATFQQVLARELLPLIESTYPALPDRRILFGHSLGGQFVLYSAQTQPSLFWGHIASNPALHRNLPFFLEWQGGGEAPADATRLFVGSGERDDPRFLLPYREWLAHWSVQAPRPFLLEARTLPGQTHFSALPETFHQGIAWLFDPDAGR